MKWSLVLAAFLVAVVASIVLSIFDEGNAEVKMRPAQISYGEYTIPRTEVITQHFQPARVDSVSTKSGTMSVSLTSPSLGDKRVFVSIRSFDRGRMAALNETMRERLRSPERKPERLAGTKLFRVADDESAHGSLLFAASAPPPELEALWYRGACRQIGSDIEQCRVLGVAGDMEYEVVLDPADLAQVEQLDNEIVSLLKSWRTDNNDRPEVLNFKG